MYLDHNAGGRVRPEVATMLADWLGSGAANPSSLHAAGRRARSAIEDARGEVAALVGAEPSEVIFTSGGTEANNLAVRGLVQTGRGVVTTAIEHASVLAAAEAARGVGAVCTVLAPDRAGRVSPSQVAAAVTPEIGLVSVGWANGEIGTVQPIAAIVAAVRALRSDTRVHTDAVQAVSQLDVDVALADADLLSLSGHKLGAPAGVGALVARRGVVPTPLLVGGPQERERRAGTENVAGIVALGCAARLARQERRAYRERAAAIGGAIWEIVDRAAQPVVRLSPPDGLPGTLSVSFPGLRGDALAVALDLRGVAVSTGSACAAGAPEPSHVLRAIGCTDEEARGALRLSFGPELDLGAAREAAEVIVDVVKRARKQARPRRRGGVSNAA